MKLWKSEKSVARDTRIEWHLERAVAAARRGDVVDEEELLQGALQCAPRFGGAMQAIQARIKALQTEGLVRQCELLGGVATPRVERGSISHYDFWSDRMVAYIDGGVTSYSTRVDPMKAGVRATVETAGTIAVTRRPTLTRMAAGSILPGTALIPGLALSKTESHDNRELWFMLEHPDWGGAVLQLDPNAGQAARELAMKINRVASAMEAAQSSPESRPSPTDARLEQLRQLGELREAGVLSEKEFESEKARILGTPGLDPAE